MITLTQLYSVPYGEGHLSFDLPVGSLAHTIERTMHRSSNDPTAAIEAALENPIAAPTLEQLVVVNRPLSLCIAFTDATRACPDRLIVTAILRRMAAAGVPDEAITLLCAVGLHRPSTEAEKRAKLGDEIVDRYRVIDHEACDPDNLVRIGCTPQGIPLEVSKLAFEADLLISTGVVEPHQYAGYSGGSKTVTIGCGGEATIAATHGPAMLDQSGVRLGRIQGNPFQAAVRQVARHAGLKFVVNAVQNEDNQLLEVCAGDPAAVHDHLVAFARDVFEVEVPHPYALAIAGVGAPKDANLYQASRAITYLQLTATPAVRPGGILVLPAPCSEGAGQGVGEQRFLEALRDSDDVESMLEEMRANGYPPGAQRAFVVGQVLSEIDVIVVGACDPQIVKDCRMIPASTMQEAFAIAAHKLGRTSEILILPHALQALVRVAENPIPGNGERP